MMHGHGMNRVLHPLLVVLIYLGMCLTSATSVCVGETYYVDAVRGLDAHSGLSPAQAWKSLVKVISQIFRPGDRILFKSGTRYAGQLVPQGSGRRVNDRLQPIVIDRYGEGARPRIDGEGKVRSTLSLYNVEYWQVSGLEITNTGETREAGRRGVTIHIKDFGTAHGITLRDLHIHDVNGSLVKKKGGGSAILWHNEGRVTRSRFDGLLIEDCHLECCGRNGINSRGNTRRDQWWPSVNVVIRRNLLEQIPGDGIVPIGCDGAVVEHNVMRDCPRLLPEGEAAAGIWPWSSDNTVIQFNEVSDHKAPWDAQGFDSDWNCRNTLIQYNYSHDNEGGFLLVCNNGGSKLPWNIGNQGTVVRYNISVNDGLRTAPTRQGFFSPSFHISGPCLDTKIYNNIIHVNRKPDQKTDTTLIKMDNWGGPWPENTVFTNNIFYAEERVSYAYGKARDTVFSNNLYFGRHDNAPKDPCAVREDPRFVDSGQSPNGIGSLAGYRLKPSSPCIGAAAPVVDHGARDFWGNPVGPEGPNSIGACEMIK
ncbi:MAG: right-handed parallel beta-helix repeat-containing protein [Planctomycetes bacterium]|nr:right-handed parallel beta-helix repeat-containing protein [Planctomycetota bacterium]